MKITSNNGEIVIEDKGSRIVIGKCDKFSLECVGDAVEFDSDILNYERQGDFVEIKRFSANSDENIAYECRNKPKKTVESYRKVNYELE